MKNTLSNNKSRFLSILVTLAAILSPIAVHAQDSYLFASVNGNTQNSGGAVFQYTSPGAQTTFAPGLSRPRGLAFYKGDLYVVMNTLDPVTGNLQPSILKVSGERSANSLCHHWGDSKSPGCNRGDCDPHLFSHPNSPKQ